MHNVEFKAELRDRDLARSVLLRMGATPIGVLEQTDTYYTVKSGRLKKRETSGERTEVIFYDRPDRSIPKLSHFSLYTEAAAAKEFGDPPGEVRIVVRKVRELLMLGSVRIHLDEVEGLGTFLEFEALVSPSQTVKACHDKIAELRQALRPALGEPIACGYADLLEQE